MRFTIFMCLLNSYKPSKGVVFNNKLSSSSPVPQTKAKQSLIIFKTTSGRAALGLTKFQYSEGQLHFKELFNYGEIKLRERLKELTKCRFQLKTIKNYLFLVKLVL